MSRRWLIPVSLLAHAVAGAGILIAGAWHIDRLDAERSTALAIVLPPSPPPEGGHEAVATTTTFTPKQERRVVHEMAQPTPVAPEPVAATATDADPGGRGTGDGEGPGTGTGIGSPTPCPPGTVCDGVPGDPVPPPAPKPPAPKPTLVAPNVLGGLRVAGETQIHPPDVVKTQMQRDGRDRIAGTVKVCVDARGAVASATMIGTTKYPAYDALLVANVRAWRYRPYTVNGTPVPACSAVTFQFSMR